MQGAQAEEQRAPGDRVRCHPTQEIKFHLKLKHGQRQKRKSYEMSARFWVKLADAAETENDVDEDDGNTDDGEGEDGEEQEAQENLWPMTKMVRPALLTKSKGCEMQSQKGERALSTRLKQRRIREEITLPVSPMPLILAQKVGSRYLHWLAEGYKPTPIPLRIPVLGGGRSLRASALDGGAPRRTSHQHKCLCRVTFERRI